MTREYTSGWRRGSLPGDSFGYPQPRLQPVKRLAITRGKASADAARFQRRDALRLGDQLRLLRVRPSAQRGDLLSVPGDDGIQLRWLAPIESFLVEFGAEGLRGDNFPAGGAAKKGNGLKKDCIDPIMTGSSPKKKTTIPLPQIDANTIAACKAEKPNFGGGKSDAAAPASSQHGAPEHPRAVPRPRTGPRRAVQAEPPIRFGR
jgi:hypothetical protein